MLSWRARGRGQRLEAFFDRAWVSLRFRGLLPAYGMIGVARWFQSSGVFPVASEGEHRVGLSKGYYSLVQAKCFVDRCRGVTSGGRGGGGHF